MASNRVAATTGLLSNLSMPSIYPLGNESNLFAVSPMTFAFGLSCLMWLSVSPPSSFGMLIIEHHDADVTSGIAEQVQSLR